MVYVFDTNSLRVLNNYYPQHFVTFWEKFNQYVQDGGIISVREVRGELERQSLKPHMKRWVRENRGIFLTPGPEETLFVAQILQVKHFQTLVAKQNILRGRPSADPFVIACAQVRNGCVVTEEIQKPNAAKIPNVCEHFEIDSTNVEGFLTREQWVF